MARGIHAAPNQYMIIGRRDDTEEIVWSVVTNLPPNARLTQMCRRALYEMGINDPLTYEFLAMCFSSPRGGTQAVLDQMTLRRYVRANYG